MHSSYIALYGPFHNGRVSIEHDLGKLKWRNSGVDLLLIHEWAIALDFDTPTYCTDIGWMGKTKSTENVTPEEKNQQQHIQSSGNKTHEHVDLLRAVYLLWFFFLSYQSFSSHCIISFIIYICVYVLITSALWKHVTYCFLFFESCIRDGWFFYSFSNFVCFFFRCRFSHMLCTNKTQQKFNLV